jgi:glycosyltransferase involved in cell wall biosynthesis
MRVLFISQMVPYLPCNDGFRLIPANILKNLSGNHEIHLISLGGKESVEQINWSKAYCASIATIYPDSSRSFNNFVRHAVGAIAPGLIEKVKASIARLKPHLLHLEGSSMASLVSLAPQGVECVLSIHDSRYLRCSQFFNYSKTLADAVKYKFLTWRYYRFERHWYNKSSRIIVTSTVDKNAILGIAKEENIEVIPNGIDFDYWFYKPEPVLGRLVFSGNMSWAPNEDAAEYFVKEIFPFIRKQDPKVEFWIVGASPTKRVIQLSREPGVKVTGTVDDIREYVRKATLYVSPLRFGAGIKNKILEAMALGTPIVASKISLTGTSFENGKHLIIAHTGPEFVKSITLLLKDACLRKRLSDSALKEVKTNYTWLDISKRFERVWFSCLKQK